MQSLEKDGELKAALHSKLEAFDKLYASHVQEGGPFLLGSTLSLAEIAVFPFLERFSASLGFYRRYDMFEGGRYPALHAALQAARARPAFASTTASPQYFIEAYKSYAVAPYPSA